MSKFDSRWLWTLIVTLAGWTPTVVRAQTSPPATLVVVTAKTQIDARDARAIPLEGAGGLSGIVLSPGKVSSRGLVLLRDCPHLRRLNLDGGSLQDEACPELAQLASVEELSLIGTRISDLGISHLGSLTRLKALDLRGTPITDQSIATLAGMASLRNLDVRGTGITDEGYRRLLRMRPDLRVYWTPPLPAIVVSTPSE